MSDFNSSLPVRTEAAGDVIAKIADATTPSQQLAVDASGRLTTKLDDGSGNPITSQANGAQQALDVGINVAGVQIDPRDIRALTAADIVTVDSITNALPAGANLIGKATISQGGNDATVTASNALKVDGSAVTQPVSGTVTANQGTSPWITKDQSDGPVAPGTVASFSSLAGGQYNSAAPTLTNGQQAALQVDSSGKLLVATSSADDHNYGVVGASTLRTAAQIGNATGAADFGAGATGAQTLRTEANLAAGTNLIGSVKVSDGTDLLAVNTDGSINVVVTDATPGTPINDYKTATVAGGGSDNHDYTVTALKTFYLNQVEASASGKAKMVISVETAVASGTFTTRFVQFNSTATTNMSVHLDNPIAVAAGVRVRVVMSNRDNASEDLYSTISGYELP